MIKNKHHRPIHENLKYIESLVKDGAKVLEIGPGHLPLVRLQIFVVGLWKKKEDYKIIK